MSEMREIKRQLDGLQRSLGRLAKQQPGDVDPARMQDKLREAHGHLSGADYALIGAQRFASPQAAEAINRILDQVERAGAALAALRGVPW